MHYCFLTLHSKIWFHFVNCRLLPSTHSTTINFDRMCLIHSIIKVRKIDVGIILHQKIIDCVERQTGILVFPSLVIPLCQQKGIVPQEDEEILDNKGPINKASVERMTRSTDASILKKAETNTTRKGKAKADSKGTNLNTETLLWRKMKDVKKMVNSTSNRQIRLVVIIEDDDFEDRDRLVASPPIVQVSNNEKGEESRDIEECLQKIDSLFEDEEEIVAEEEKVVENGKEREDEASAVNIVTAPESVSANINNLELDGERLAEVAKVTSEERDNTLAIVVYTGPL
ncbi:hypothetical protein PVK06_012066 [Gossypium arboreum]|uniref:Putative plant transposon protein domain-containing protein n=1 Tax=Gossypium arboreum TaxID=29729 RepID=A0ABR0QBN3_GOSAR|nr:hypothetical protein PVK06_012066 [Gossypium arboreum]